MKRHDIDNYATDEHNYPDKAHYPDKNAIPSARGLYNPSSERDACGLGIIADFNRKPSHATVVDALTVLKNLEHRGAVGGDRKTGDGAGILCQIPDRFFRHVMSLEKELPDAGDGENGISEGLPYGIGMFFLPCRPDDFLRAKALVNSVSSREGLSIIGWRDVPVLPQVLGERAGRSMPRICQAVFIGKRDDGSAAGGDAFERRLYLLRKAMEKVARTEGFSINEFYIPSLSSRTIVYKGMFVASQFASFYPDLGDELFESRFAVVHQRYSTNTFPSWPLAQPFRMISHNGEINTLRKNMNAMRARQATMESPLFGPDFGKLLPVVEEAGSDSAMFDNVFELLVRSGRPPEHVFMMMVPEPHSSDFGISRDKKAFYEYHAALMEGWDGPAAMTFTDGRMIGAALDRNGLRPFRYTLGKDGRFVGASEAGVLDLDESNIVEKGMLKPGTMLLVDLVHGRLVKDREIKSRICREKPYRRWLENNHIELRGLFSASEPAGQTDSAGTDGENLSRLAAYFRYDEETSQVLKPMLVSGQEALSAMGTRKPPAALERSPVLLYSYFHQLFAQVTNPPIDPYRENLVMSLENYIGRQRNLLEESPEHCRQLKLLHPLLSNSDIHRLRATKIPDFKVASVSMLFPEEKEARPADGAMLEAAIGRICADAEKCIDEGVSLLILSDRGVDAEHAAVPALLATSALHGYLVDARKRHMAGLVVETGEAREIHQIAVLLAYGASGVNPWMVFEQLPRFREAFGVDASPRVENLADNYIESVKKGVLKMLSKLGISTISSYRGARLYETVGLSDTLAARFFRGTESRFGGIGLAEIESDILEHHARVMAAPSEGGLNGQVVQDGHEERTPHRELPWPPRLAALLTRAVRENDAEAWRVYVDGMDDPRRQPFTLRDLFSFKPTRAIPLDKVQPAAQIVARCSVAAMSCGAISPEAHEALAAGANSAGAWSNSGEGGEDEGRDSYRAAGFDSSSASRQVASGRFGVTVEYAAGARELQIKIAQGAKPGEGGQLPGSKVDDYIARLRHAAAGRTLISPPPHHDIYSIEDLSQLIHDLHCVNPAARIAVKLAAQAGIGAVAAGVAKAGADCVIVSSGDGGTGAAPRSSLDYMGNAWESALPEIRQVLAMNGLDANVVVQVDGRLRTARDIVIAAILGAREFAFGTLALISVGCIACGQCNLDRCPVGIATQKPELRGKFKGRPEHVAAFFRMMAEDVRILLASLGAKSLDEVAGKWELLDFTGRAATPREKLLSFEKIIQALEISRRYPLEEEGDTDGSGPPVLPLPPAGLGNFDARRTARFSPPEIDELVLRKCLALPPGERLQMDLGIRNSDRSIGARLSGALRRADIRLAPDAVHVNFEGSAGQSFGAFLSPGIFFRLSGEANDYLGKSLSGGRIAVLPRIESKFSAEMNIIAGNVCLFGATGGEVFLNGMVGERFCVRNSGALAVAEGTGDHACEYMTGGSVIVLGRTGVNFGAGMTGGVAFVLDEDQLFDTRCNPVDVDLEACAAAEDVAFLKAVIGRHHLLTGSPRARSILSAWEEYRPLFVKVTPR